jgi:hypothetical protein
MQMPVKKINYEYKECKFFSQNIESKEWRYWEIWVVSSNSKRA